MACCGLIAVCKAGGLLHAEQPSMAWQATACRALISACQLDGVQLHSMARQQAVCYAMIAICQAGHVLCTDGCSPGSWRAAAQHGSKHWAVRGTQVICRVPSVTQHGS